MPSIRRAGYGPLSLSTSSISGGAARRPRNGVLRKRIHLTGLEESGTVQPEGEAYRLKT